VLLSRFLARVFDTKYVSMHEQSANRGTDPSMATATAWPPRERLARLHRYPTYMWYASIGTPMTMAMMVEVSMSM